LRVSGGLGRPLEPLVGLFYGMAQFVSISDIPF